MPGYLLPYISYRSRALFFSVSSILCNFCFLQWSSIFNFGLCICVHVLYLLCISLSLSLSISVYLVFDEL